MVIVLVFWYIKIGGEQEFLDHWAGLDPRVKIELYAEFLCEPMQQAEITDFKVEDFVPDHPSCTVFVNVGLWRNERAFAEAIRPNDQRELFPFEEMLPTRAIITRRNQHMGQWSGDWRPALTFIVEEEP